MKNKDADPLNRRDRLAYIDFDGEKLSPGKNYKDYKRARKLKKKLFKNPCKHNKVMRTLRCTGCHQVHVVFVRGMVK